MNSLSDRVPRRFIFLVLAVFLTSCRPNYEDWSREWRPIFQGYIAGDVHTAKAALLEEERLIAKHQARGNRSLNFRTVRLALYGHLCGICDHMGHTSEAKVYFQKYVENLDGRPMTYDELIVRAKKADDMLKPKWREQK